MKYLNLLRWFLVCILPSVGCSPEASESKTEQIDERGNQNIPAVAHKSRATEKSLFKEDVESIIENGLIAYNIRLDEDEKKEALREVREFFSSVEGHQVVSEMQFGMKLMLDLREAQLKGDENVESHLNEHLGVSFSKSSWESIVFNSPDIDALSNLREKFKKQFPLSGEDALFQAQDALFKQALTQKLRDEITKEITSVTSSEVEDFRTNYRNGSTSYVLYMSQHRNFEAAALELKKDLFWNHWIALQQK